MGCKGSGAEKNWFENRHGSDFGGEAEAFGCDEEGDHGQVEEAAGVVVRADRCVEDEAVQGSVGGLAV